MQTSAWLIKQNKRKEEAIGIVWIFGNWVPMAHPIREMQRRSIHISDVVVLSPFPWSGICQSMP
jgi:hypothetical protein